MWFHTAGQCVTGSDFSPETMRLTGQLTARELLVFFGLLDHMGKGEY
jgi:hypothetical protein